MRQLLLDLLPDNPPTLNNFVAGRDNGETLAALTLWLTTADETSFCLYGLPGSGCSHLLRASGWHYVDALHDPDLNQLGEHPRAAVDHIESLSMTGQIALFNRFNHCKARGGKLLTAAHQPPSALTLREDLRTRLGSGLIYRLQPLSDSEKMTALSAQAENRALKIPTEALTYLLHHAPRDMRALSSLIVALDRYTLEHHRAVTVPLLRELLIQERSA